MKKAQMVVVSFIKIGLALLGLLGTFWFLIVGLISKDKSNFNRAGVIFAGTWVILIAITVIEFAILK